MTGAPVELRRAVEAKVRAWTADPPMADSVDIGDGVVKLSFGAFGTGRLVLFAQKLFWWWTCVAWVYSPHGDFTIPVGALGVRFIEAWRAKYEGEAARRAAAQVGSL